MVSGDENVAQKSNARLYLSFLPYIWDNFIRKSLFIKEKLWKYFKLWRGKNSYLTQTEFGDIIIRLAVFSNTSYRNFFRR